MSCPDCIMNPDGPCAKCSDSLAELIERKYPSGPVHGKTITMKCKRCNADYCEHDWAEKSAADLVNSPTVGCCADYACDYDCASCKIHADAIARALRASANPAYKMAWDLASDNMTNTVAQKYFSGDGKMPMGIHYEDGVPMMFSGFTFLPESKVWVFRLPGIQFHLRPDGEITKVIEK